jgi:D-alanyl-D-alanine carboxypeptidase (penicillin-binding protein 5/6)
VTSDDAPPPSRRALRESTAPTDTIVVRNRAGRRALAWVDDETVTGRGGRSAIAAAPDLLLDVRGVPLRAGVVVPLLTAIGVCGAYAAATLLWPLWAVAPTVREITPDGPVATASAVAWPSAGAGAVGVAGFDAVAASSSAPVSMASISKVVTVLMILDEMPLSVGQPGPEFTFTSRDRQTYWDYLADDESALDVPSEARSASTRCCRAF